MISKIDSNKTYEAALARIDELLSTGDSGQSELAHLADLVAAYEEIEMPEPALSPDLIAAIRVVMATRRLNQQQLAAELGISAPRISEYLRGRRGLTLEIARRIHERLDIPAELILQRP